MVQERRYQVSIKLIRILRALHQGTRGAVRAYGKVSEVFNINTGVRQGDILVPVLFNPFLDTITAATLSHMLGLVSRCSSIVETPWWEAGRK